jgi:thiopeptide-type bacteriocin biosynthesis protein
MKNYQFLSQLLLRSPFYNYHEYSPAKADEILNDPYFQTALYLASPLFYQQLASKHFDFNSLSAKEKLSILKYYNRMSFRSTPFGSFSSFTMAEWGQDELIRLDADKNGKLHLNIDQEIVLPLAEALIGNEFEKYTYICNPGLYKSGKEFRFIKTNYSDDKKNVIFALESFEYNALTVGLIEFCTGNFKHGKEIVAFMREISGCDLETARDYLNFLVSAQIVIAHTANNIIGEDYLLRLLNYAENAASSFSQSLHKIYQQLHIANFPSVNPLIKLTNQLKSLFSDLGKPNQFFYAGLERKVSEGSLAVKYQQQITDGLKALSILAQPVQPSILLQFIQDFKNRYDRQKVPLLQAIDPETGIGYGPLTTQSSEKELLHLVNFKGPKDNNISLEWSAVHQLLLKRWTDNLYSTDSIQLNDEDLHSIPSNLTLSSPPTLSVVFRIIENGIYLETVGGVSATALIGRFTTWSEEVHNLSQQIASQEQLLNRAVVFADIGQLSDTHADNINRRKHSYEYEISVNAVSTLSSDHQIALSDLWISVAGDKLILESASLQKVIIPRLSSAYNYNRNNLAVFRMLCDLQYQGLQGNYSLDLEQYFPGMAQYPRVTYKQTILCPALWHLSAQDLKELKSLTEDKAITRFKMIQEKLKLPAIVGLSKFDQQLVFNTEKPKEVSFLLECLKGMDNAILQEFFFPVGSVINNEGNPMIDQFIAFLYKTDGVYGDYQTTETVAKSKIKQEYILGSKWLYLKIYCNPTIANNLLVKKLLPLLQQFDQNTLFSWFFIRYKDSGCHIRLRLKVREEFIGHVLIKLKKRFADKVRYHVIREYQADTYRREIERYGPDIIQLVEGFFHGSSELILNYIKISAFKSFRNTYHSMAFVSVAYLLNSFLPEIDGQIIFLEQMVNTFYSEFSNDKSLRIDMDLKYRELKNEIKGLLNGQGYYEILKLSEWSRLFEEKTVHVLKATSGFTSKRKTQLLADLIHMHLNRLFIDRQRNQELIIYYCLYKHQISVKAVANKA